MSQSFKLFRLQGIDSDLERSKSRLGEIEISLNYNPDLIKAQDIMETTSQTLQEARKGLQIAERNVQDQQIKIQQSEAILYSGKVKNPKELQDIQSEVAALNRYADVLEDRQLDAMILVEDAENDYTAASTHLKTVEMEIADKNKRLLEEQSSLFKYVDRLDYEHQVAAGSIPPEDLRLYGQLRKQKNGVAVARVAGTNCMACGATLTAGLRQKTESSHHLTHCTTCGRILYVG